MTPTPASSPTPTPTATRLWALDAPRMTMDAAHLVVGAQGSVTIPLPAFLIEHERGLVLFDTSMDPRVCEDPALVFGDRPETGMIEATPEQRIDRQLAALGFRTEDVTHVVLSHTHSDHAGGLHLFPQARFFAGPGEFRWAANPTNGTAYLFGEADLASPVPEYDWHELDAPVLDLFGDGAIAVHHTPGHTPGELSALVRLPSRNLILTGDTVHLREAMEWDAAYPQDWDTTLAQRSIATLKRLQADEDAALWIGHDPRDWEDFGGPLVAQE